MCAPRMRDFFVSEEISEIFNDCSGTRGLKADTSKRYTKNAAVAKSADAPELESGGGFPRQAPCGCKSRPPHFRFYRNKELRQLTKQIGMTRIGAAMAIVLPETAKGAEYKKDKARNGCEALKAIDPHDGGQWDLLISHSTLDRVAREGMGKSKELAYIVRPSPIAHRPSPIAPRTAGRISWCTRH